MRKLLKAYDKNLQATGVLLFADQVERKRRLNSDYGLSFIIPMDQDDYKLKTPLKGHVQDEKGQYYVINGRKRSREGLKRMAQIDCTHIMFKLVDFKMPYTSYIEEDFGVNIVTLTNLITAATYGKFVFSIDSVFDVKDIKDFGRGNAMEALVFIIKTYGCEVDPNNFLIHLKAKIGADNGLQYRYKKNIMTSSFADSTQGLVTRMYGEMKDGLTFIGLPASNLTSGEYALLNSVPGAIVGGIIKVNYLISQYASTWANTTNTYFDGEHIDQDIEDQLELLIATRKALMECEVPSIDVTVNAADLFKIDSTEPKPNIGDTAYLIDPLMDMNNITARVVEITEYPYQLDKHTTVTLANYMLRDYKDIIADLDTSKRIVDDLMSGGRVRLGAFELLAKEAIDDINNSKTQVIYDGRGIVLQSIPLPSHQVVMSAEGIYLTIDGGAHAFAAITANGVIADRIIGNIGSFVTMSADSIVTGSLSGINMSIGSLNNVFKASSAGIQLGHAVFASAPFRVDMAGNAFAKTMTLETPSITNGHIVGTDINVGSGQFVVDAVGHLTASSATIRGDITSGSTITGAVIRTSSGNQRMQIDTSFLNQFDSLDKKILSLGSSGLANLQFFYDTSIGTIAFTNGLGLFINTITGSNEPIRLTAGTQIIYLFGSDINLNGTLISSINSSIGSLNSSVSSLNSSVSSLSSSKITGTNNSFIKTGLLQTQDIKIQWNSGTTNLEVFIDGSYVGSLNPV